MMQFEGDREYPLPPAKVWSKLSDARFLVQCIPGSESVSKAEADEAVCVIRPGFAFARGTLNVTLRVVERVPDTSVKLALVSKGIGSSSDVTAALLLTAADSGTRLHWTAEVVQLGGLLKAVPKGLIRGAAQKVIEDVWESLSARLKIRDS
jgi:carbon monoxide dehydrogenase subunit G